MKLFGKSQSKKTEVYPEPETVSPFSEAEAAVEAPLVLKIEGSDSAEKPAPPKLVLQEAKADGTPEGDLLSELEDILGQNAEKAEPEIVIPDMKPIVPEEAPALTLRVEDAVPSDPDAYQPAAAVAETAVPLVATVLEAPSAIAEAAEALEAPVSEIPAPDKAETPSAADQPEAGAAEAEKPAEPEAEKAAEPEAEKPEEPEAEKPAEPEGEKPLTAVTFAEVAEAITARRDQVKEPTLTRSAIDDDTLLAEIYALIGEGGKRRPAPKAEAAEAAPEQTKAEPEAAEPVRSAVPAAPAPAAPVEAPQPPVHISSSESAFYEGELTEEADNGGAPGWLKGIFLLLISLMLSGMTLYAVATDLIGKLF